MVTVSFFILFSMCISKHIIELLCEIMKLITEIISGLLNGLVSELRKLYLGLGKAYFLIGGASVKQKSSLILKWGSFCKKNSSSNFKMGELL